MVLAGNYTRAIVLVALKASGLRDADWAGKSDPYCVFSDFDGEVAIDEVKTKVIDNCLDPVWNEGFVVLCDGDTSRCNIEVYDYDATTKDSLGKTVLNLKEGEGLQTLALDDKGSVTVAYHVYDLEELAKSAKRWDDHSEGDVEINGDMKKLLLLTVDSCEGLKDADWGGKSDPYVMLREFSGAAEPDEGKTRIAPDTLDPKFDETFVHIIADDCDRVELSVYDDDVGGDDRLGTAIVMLDKRSKEETLALDKKGTITYNYLCVELTILCEAAKSS